jgi:hypothetical protein
MFLNYNFASRINDSGQIPAQIRNCIQLENRFSADITWEAATVAGEVPKNVIKRDDIL